jgi:hypothetical protein
MHIVVRNYSGQGSSELFDLLERSEQAVKDLLGGVPGFVSYAAFRTADGGGMTVTACEDETGTEESSRRAAEWAKENVSAAVEAPTITDGSTVLQFSA